MQVREVGTQIEGLASVEANLPGPRLEQVVAGDVALQDILWMAPAADSFAQHSKPEKEAISTTDHAPA